MPIQVKWDNPERTVLRVNFDDPWDWADYQSVSIATAQMMETIPHPVALIVNADTIDRLPPGALSQFRQSDHFVLDNLGPIYVVNANPFINLLINTLGKVSFRLGQRLRLAASLEEAYSQIAREMVTPS